MDKVVHFEIPAADMERADKFYNQAFGWGINKAPMGPGYDMVTTTETDEQMMIKDPEDNVVGLWQNLKAA